MKNRYFLIGLAVMGIGLGGAGYAEEPRTEDVKINGVVFSMAADRKVEKVGGLYQPEAIDKYVERRIGELSERFGKLESKMDELNRKLDQLNSGISAQSSDRSSSGKDVLSS